MAASLGDRLGQRQEGLDQDARRQPRRVVSLSRSCPRPSPGSTPIGNRRVSIDPGERVEGLDQDARRQPRRAVSLSRVCPRPSPGSALFGNPAA